MPKAAAGHPLALPPWRVDPTMTAMGDSPYRPAAAHRVPRDGYEPVVGSPAMFEAVGAVGSGATLVRHPSGYGRDGRLVRPPRLVAIYGPGAIDNSDVQTPDDPLSFTPDYQLIGDTVAAGLTQYRVDVALSGSGYPQTASTGVVIPPLVSFALPQQGWTGGLPDWDPTRVVGGRVFVVVFGLPNGAATLGPDLDFMRQVYARERVVWPDLATRCDRLGLAYLYDPGDDDSTDTSEAEAAVGGLPGVTIAPFRVLAPSAEAGSIACANAVLSAAGGFFD